MRYQTNYPLSNPALLNESKNNIQCEQSYLHMQFSILIPTHACSANILPDISWECCVPIMLYRFAYHSVTGGFRIVPYVHQSQPSIHSHMAPACGFASSVRLSHCSQRMGILCGCTAAAARGDKSREWCSIRKMSQRSSALFGTI